MTYKRYTPAQIQQMEDEAVKKLLITYTKEEVELMKINLQAIVAPIIRKQFEGFYIITK